ncbi:MAG: hypothetical protein J0G29_04785 [Alphaproteobacteria bacterium]|nr:hypothetical protein [Alphaproteobacteria bacterium]
MQVKRMIRARGIIVFLRNIQINDQAQAVIKRGIFIEIAVKGAQKNKVAPTPKQIGIKKMTSLTETVVKQSVLQKFENRRTLSPIQ